ncbi:DUF86 domain-containing protein [Myxococcota bacterium]|nr:DUF86 domain-containing protein [Myxococcota bacterium]MBU1535761.1 DUF86 domain-containing protein [Myxococcota bacterium]
MPRDPRLYLDDIMEAISLVREYTHEMSFPQFSTDRKTQDAVIRNLEVIGEASARLPEALRAKEPGMDWRKMVGMRNILAHAYFGVSITIVWDAVQTKLQPLEQACIRLLQHLDE